MRAIAEVPTTYTVQEVADILKVSRDMVEKLVSRGELGHKRVGRFIRITPAQLDAFLADDEEEGGEQA